MDEQLRQAALDYHVNPTPGKLAVVPTKGLTNQRDLALAYSPGVAAACLAIVDDPGQAAMLTSRGNLVAVVTNGTAVLGLGDIGPLAGKPVMEGKACLFKKFAGIDVFDIELAERDPDAIIDTVARLEPTFGGINLEDIKAPECFYIEKKLRERMKIPVFHDDQHGTAIIASAALLNGMQVIGKQIGEIKLVCSGAGAAAIACLDLLVKLGLSRQNVLVADKKGVIFAGRETEMEPNKARYARDTQARTLADAIVGADVFIGLSGPGLLTPEMVNTMARDPLIFALANPEPEIRPEVARAARPDAIVATGRSDYPNQVNNVLCFPFIFRGALDVGATTITEEMKMAAVRAIAELARAQQSDAVAEAYAGQSLSFGRDYLIPKPFDPRLIVTISPAVARAAMEGGVATRPIADLEAYRERLSATFVHGSSMFMRPVFERAKVLEAKVAYADGEDERVLRCVQTVVDEGLARPLLVGRRGEIEAAVTRMGLRVRPDTDFDLVEAPASADAYGRTAIATDLLASGQVDGILCGLDGTHRRHLDVVRAAVPCRSGSSVVAALSCLMLPGRTLFLLDTYVNEDPTADEVAAMTVLACAEMRRFGITPKVALLSHSSYGSADTLSARKMRAARALLASRAPDLDVDGEMHGDAALSAAIREKLAPGARLKGEANLLVFPNLDAANIAFNLLKVVAGEGVTIGPILLGLGRPAHVLTPTATVRRMINMTALVVVEASRERGRVNT